ncbi:type I 3-dehydroquinate dehydratase [Actinobaculum suis]|uniref:type I 3-dehydroquinate dehydratase n=1 Tax=Actinobaculum suis TaxID=1657 RepID=UPI00080878CA|nr:type I 3-dehydroquinate dehydratase [Actinobaculum suis]OCA94623.1 type I 3-dehydroquinate dehydratase [Actinobaculum suis]OCA94935.1 type I 3-dehydroquinate dehydratase [Actinobaculum suis]
MPIVRVGDAAIGSGPTKIFVPITPATPEEMSQQVAELPAGIDVLEWRVDFLRDSCDATALKQAAAYLRDLTDLPILATFRMVAEGGQRAVMPEQYAQILFALIQSGKIDAIDVQIFRTENWTQPIITAAAQAQVPVLASYHDHRATPPEDEIVNRLRLMQVRGTSIGKIAVQPQNAGDVFTLMRATWRASEELHIPLITMAMRALGAISRIAPSLYGSAATWSTDGHHDTAAGQLPVNELLPVLETVDRWAHAHDSWHLPKIETDAAGETH